MDAQPIRVLVLEDNRSHAQLLRESLAAVPGGQFTLTICECLQEALPVLSAQPLDVVLLDLLLPDSEGLQAFTAVRNRVPSLPVVVLTGVEDEALGLEAVRQGAQDYLVKGQVDGRMLVRIIRYAIERKRAEEQLREREEFFRLISENVTDLIAVIDGDGRRLYNSPSYRNLLGDPEHLRGTDSFSEIHPEDRARIRQLFLETVATGAGQRAEYRFVTGRGDIRYIESQGSVIKDAAGHLGKVVVVSRDITERKQAEIALRESEQRYKRLLSSTTDYIFTVTVRNGRPSVTQHGPGCEAVTGYTSADYEADHYLWFRMVHEEDRAAVVQQAANVLAGQNVVPLEHRLWHKDGTLRWVKNTPVPHLNSHGRLISYDGLITDITERKVAELALAQERNLLRTLIDSLPDQIYVVNTANRYLLDNVAHRRFLGAAAAEALLGKRLSDFFPPRMVASSMADDQAVLNSGQPLISREEPVEEHGGAKRWVSTTKVPLRDRQGRIVGLVGISRDITDRKRMQEERDRFFTLSLDMLCIAGFDGYYKQLNPAWEDTLGYTKAELMAEPYLNFVHPEDREVTRAENESLSHGELTSTFENRFRCKDGSYKWLSWSACPFREQQLIYAAARDITERKRSEAELKRANTELARSEEALRKALADLQKSHEQLKEAQLQLIQAEKMESVGTLAAGVAHEVKNPLQTILMGVDYLTSQVAKRNPTVTQVLADMREAISSADTIVRGLLEFSAAHQPDLKEEDVNSVVENALWLVNFELYRQPITVVRQLETDLPRLQLDRQKLSQAFINLFLNAIHAMPGGGTLLVRTYSRKLADPPVQMSDRSATTFFVGETVVVVEIEDSGTGIPEDKLVRVFDPFFTTKPVGKGTGLGLTVVQRIIELHHAMISIRNRAEGGVKATITFKTQRSQP